MGNKLKELIDKAIELFLLYDIGGVYSEEEYQQELDKLIKKYEENNG